MSTANLIFLASTAFAIAAASAVAWRVTTGQRVTIGYLEACAWATLTLAFVGVFGLFGNSKPLALLLAVIGVAGTIWLGLKIDEIERPALRARRTRR